MEADAMPDFLVFTTLFLKLFGIKVILNMLDFVPHLYADRFKAKPNHPIVRLLQLVEKASMSYADHIIFPHSEVQGRYVENQGLADSKTSVILNVPDENIFYPRIAPSTEGKTFQLISHGSILEKYGVQTLIKAVPLLIPSIPELQVRIVGSGEYRPQLEALVQDLNLEDRVHFTGFIPMEQIPDIICQADIGVITTIIQMMPTKLFEYVALGRPVITTIFPAVTDYFSDGTVMYYEAGDEYALARCVLELYHNPERRASLATLASTVYQGYRWDTMKYEYLKVFEQLTGPQHVAGGGGQIRK